MTQSAPFDCRGVAASLYMIDSEGNVYRSIDWGLHWKHYDGDDVSRALGEKCKNLLEDYQVANKRGFKKLGCI